MSRHHLQGETIIDPARVIVDAHHHLWDRPGSRYLLEDFLEDTDSGHKIAASVYVQCRSMYRTDGPEEMRVIGETEFAVGAAEKCASAAASTTRACAAISGHANLLLGSRVVPVLEAHLQVGGSRFRGIRHISAWDADESLRVSGYDIRSGLLGEPRFRDGVGSLGRFGLCFEAFLFHPQIPELIALARAFPDTDFVLNHVGTPLRVGAYAGRENDVFTLWRSHVIALARCPNVSVKLGGFGMHWLGFPFDVTICQPSSEQLAAAWRPFIETCIEAFGVTRCMFESNFPVDGRSTNSRVLWNAFKRVALNASEAEKDWLFSRTAARIYGLALPDLGA